MPTASSTPCRSTGPPGEPALPDRDTRPVAAGDPAGLAAQLATAARAIADAGSSGEELGRAGHLQQVAVAALAARPDWDGAVAAALPAGTRDAVAVDVSAVR